MMIRGRFSILDSIMLLEAEMVMDCGLAQLLGLVLGLVGEIFVGGIEERVRVRILSGWVDG